jgi:hypothetical protein
MNMGRRKSTSAMRLAQDAIPGSEMSDIAFCAWVSQATEGEALVYYRGFLAVDTETELAGIIHDADASSQKLLFYAQVSPEARG